MSSDVTSPAPWPGGQARTVLELQRPARPRDLTELRHALMRWQAGNDLPRELAVDVQLATYEALANAVHHAYPDSDGTVELRARHDPGLLRIEVTDHGHWQPWNSSPGSRSRGLLLIHELTHHVTININDQGTTVALTWRLDHYAAPYPTPE